MRISWQTDDPHTLLEVANKEADKKKVLYLDLYYSEIVSRTKIRQVLGKGSYKKNLEFATVNNIETSYTRIEALMICLKKFIKDGTQVFVINGVSVLMYFDDENLKFLKKLKELEDTYKVEFIFNCLPSLQQYE